MELGVYVVNIINILLVAPPLVVGEEDIDKGMAALDETLKLADREAK
jgi:taurine--2-oxoglutarate transaminase